MSNDNHDEKGRFSAGQSVGAGEPKNSDRRKRLAKRIMHIRQLNKEFGSPTKTSQEIKERLAEYEKNVAPSIGPFDKGQRVAFSPYGPTRGIDKTGTVLGEKPWTVGGSGGVPEKTLGRIVTIKGDNGRTYKVIHSEDSDSGMNVRRISSPHPEHTDTHPDANEEKKAKLSALKKGKYRPPGASSEEMNRPAKAKALEPWEKNALVNKLLGRKKK